MSAYNGDTQYYWFLVSFSLLSIVLQCFPVSYRVHCGLFTANILSLIGVSIMLLYSHDAFYNMYAATFQSIVRIDALHQIWFVNLVAWLVHALPVLWWSRIYKPGFLDITTKWIVLYLALFGPYLTHIYPFELNTLMAIGAITCALTYAIIR
jgi:hypothetical protein